jgi:hypothetical protein
MNKRILEVFFGSLGFQKYFYGGKNGETIKGSCHWWRQ